jgi:hypothetical protein
VCVLLYSFEAVDFLSLVSRIDAQLTEKSLHAQLLLNPTFAMLR